jgi:peroxiredoxin Q/BCP
MTTEFQLEEGDFAPDFTLDTSGGGNITLSALQGKNVVIYFYPKDNTPGCTTESKDFASMHNSFDSNNTVIIGISKDSVASHDKFVAKFGFPFKLASDEDGSVCEAYGVWGEKNMYGKKYMGITRATLLIDKKGAIAKIWPKVKVAGHVEEVLAAVRGL